MKGYTAKETSTEHAPEVVEDKVVVYFDADDEAWRIDRTTVTRRTTETTARHTSSSTFATYSEAANTAEEEHDLPVYVPADDRHRAETELAEAAEVEADRAAEDGVRRQRRATAAVAKEG